MAMEGMSGDLSASRLREYVPELAVSSTSGDTERFNSIRLTRDRKCLQFVKKPFKKTEFLNALASLLPPEVAGTMAMADLLRILVVDDEAYRCLFAETDEFRIFAAAFSAEALKLLENGKRSPSRSAMDTGYAWHRIAGQAEKRGWDVIASWLFLSNPSLRGDPRNAPT